MASPDAGQALRPGPEHLRGAKPAPRSGTLGLLARAVSSAWATGALALRAALLDATATPLEAVAALRKAIAAFGAAPGAAPGAALARRRGR
eukprot:CAMPEP_0202070108 /NCGR_PEP_ID=MMETSP0964-20121228/942_2 /ASSEMBLY_ACC=CAM_ASM_000500 /TAXON_ID=4773 /ORGANISM="Schizochytrium aggregatum, Strain ATCC28209" /LENGTH=90 /DNA_ID=CAMNT_0048636945 /DNA_START=290 /DNA_END=559 /DNA_ORIENTATION=-